MKVLQVNCVYKVGSTGKIVYDIHSLLEESGNDSVVCYGRGNNNNDCGVYKVTNECYAKFNNLLSRITGIMYGGCFFSTYKLIRIINRERPDIVHLHCINGYFVNIYKLLNWLKKNNIKTVLTLHAEFMYTGSCGHSYECSQWIVGCQKCKKYKQISHSLFGDKSRVAFDKMKNAFENYEQLTVVSVSPWLKERAEQSKILKNKNHTVILNGVNTDVFRNRVSEDLFDKEYGNSKKVLYVTADFADPMKGGHYIIELAKRLPEVLFFVVGSYDSKIDLPNNVVNVGRVKNQYLLAQYYSMADLTVITSKRETFSMICAESLSCGTPVIGFKAGAPEQISIDEYSDFCEYGDIDSLLLLTEKWLKQKVNKDVIEKKAQKIYSKMNMFNNYLKLYNEMLKQ
ncbi:MAG: glycosyltransferase [Lachnospiraceae bacterium]|nr:glycosyltransferase [Lachnospiraceae bacterium]